MTDRLITTSRKGVLAVEFLTEKYRLSGEVTLKGQPLIDTLNDKMSAYIKIENLYVSPVDDPTVFTAQYPSGQLRKDNIIAVVLAREEDGTARHSLFQAKPDAPVLFALFAVVASYEIRGGIKLPSPVDVDNMLMQTSDIFFTLYRATATRANNSDIRFAGGSLLLNRTFANLFCVEKATQANG